MDLYTVLENRRSIRKYLPDPVETGTLRKLLEAARLAPSWKNGQCWRFLVIRDPEKRERLAAALPEMNPARKGMAEAPVTIVLCTKPEESERHEGKDYYLLDAGLAMQQLMLAARAEGLGTCWVAWFDEEKIRRICSVPPEYRIVALTPLGVPARQPSPRGRKPLEEIAFLEEWGRPFN